MLGGENDSDEHLVIYVTISLILAMQDNFFVASVRTILHLILTAYLRSHHRGVSCGGAGCSGTFVLGVVGHMASRLGRELPVGRVCQML